MTYKPISDYGVIGDMHSAALVASDGAIDWLCFPRFDSPSVFAAILDDKKGGRFRIGAAGDHRREQSYLPDSNVLVTTFQAGSGTATLTDFMPVEEDVTRCHHELARIVRCDSGRVELELEFVPRLDYAQGRTAVSAKGERVAVARQGEDCLSLSSAVPLTVNKEGATARFALGEGESAAFLLRWQDDSPPGVVSEAEISDLFEKLGKTQAFWRFISRDWRYQGRWEGVVRRSLLALHLLLYVPTGAVCAAVTTSLPEYVGGQRNWDYRFCWLRDAAFTMDIFNRIGHTTYTKPFIQWLANFHLTSEDDPHALYGIAREADPHIISERTLEHLEGYRGSRPVRAGNDAVHQFQLDVFGEVLLSLDSYQRAGGIIDDKLWGLAQTLVEAAIRNWQKPDNGIWEVRADPKHFVYSKLMAWVAVDRGLRMARALKRPVDFSGWRKARAAIRRDILSRGWSDKREAFVQHYGANNLDASVLFVPMVGFLPADEPRMASTMAKVRQELQMDGLLRRYIPAETEDGLDGEEGAFTMCSLWLAGVLTVGGQIEEAKGIFERVISLGNHVGLYSEMIDPRNGEFLGNYPQAFTHIALIHTARNLDRALNRVELGKVVAA
ncbi:MAG: glycoside hydrolase family 15 protein [Chloroflexi bacterium]|nr:glycoside hydrolase family 15 protein [Chloroflexota bacterium]